MSMLQTPLLRIHKVRLMPSLLNEWVCVCAMAAAACQQPQCCNKLGKFANGPESTTGVVASRFPDCDTCIVCQEDIVMEANESNPLIILSCSHCYHVDCLYYMDEYGVAVIAQNRQCMACRAPYTANDINDIRHNMIRWQGDYGLRLNRRVRYRDANGNVVWLTNEGVNLTRTRVVYKDSHTVFLQGEAPNERIVKIEYIRNAGSRYAAVATYEGLAGNERLTTYTYTLDGTKNTYRGMRGREVVARTTWADGSTRTFNARNGGYVDRPGPPIPDGGGPAAQRPRIGASAAAQHVDF